MFVCLDRGRGHCQGREGGEAGGRKGNGRTWSQVSGAVG